jgi:hypothetical protein
MRANGPMRRVVRAIARQMRGRDIQTGTRSSSISMRRSYQRKGADSRSFRSTLRRRSWAAITRTGGTDYRPKGDPLRVKVHDFEDKTLGKVAPYGVYDVTANEGWVSVGNHRRHGRIRVASIRRWLERLGRQRYPEAREVTITADCGERRARTAEGGRVAEVCRRPARGPRPPLPPPGTRQDAGPPEGEDRHGSKANLEDAQAEA